MYGLQNGALAQTEQEAIKGPKITNHSNGKTNGLIYKKKQQRNEKHVWTPYLSLKKF